MWSQELNMAAPYSKWKKLFLQHYVTEFQGQFEAYFQPEYV